MLTDAMRRILRLLNQPPPKGGGTTISEVLTKRREVEAEPTLGQH